MDDLDIFGDEGELALPTMRGNANLNAEDYARGPRGTRSSILDDDLEEDTPSTPGRNPGAAAAPDIDGTSSWQVQDDDDEPGMDQTTYGAHPWGPSAGTGYRPQSMQRTDAALRDSNLGDVGTDNDPTRRPKRMERDDMHSEPEVMEVDDSVQISHPGWTGNRNQRPSNQGIPADTMYDRESYEYDDSSQDTIGSGIFDMEEGVTWRPRDGSFAHQYALPAYIGDEDELGVQQSEMFDTTANEWRVTQPSAGGVALKTRVQNLKPGFSPFVKRPVAELRPEVTGPRSHVEAFGRAAAKLVVAEAKSQAPAARGVFIESATKALGPTASENVAKVAKTLVDMGHSPETALEDTLAHAIMHATARDLQNGRGSLPSLDRLAGRVRRTRGAMQKEALKHIAPLVKSKPAKQADLSCLYRSPAASGMGQVSTDATATSAATSGSTLFTTRNLIIAGLLGAGGYWAWTNRKTITRNAKRWARKAGF